MGRFGSVFVASVLAAAAAGLTATAVLAADLPVPAAAPAYYPPPPAHYDWTGFYFGGHLGAGLGEDAVTTTTTTALLNAGTRTNVSPDGVIGGPQVGLQYELAPIVVGVEATWTSSSASENQNTVALLAITQEQSQTEAHWYATVVGKLGFAANDLLFYAKGGGAWMRVDYTQNTLINGAFGAGAAQQLITDTRTGWTAGAGVEYAFNENLSARLEYDYLGFGTKNYNFTNIQAGGLPVSIKSDLQTLTAGLNYRFYWGGGFAK
jgi:outer membrane immunogenic protein